MESGELQFDLYVTSFGSKDNRNIKITIESETSGEDGGISTVHYLTGIEANRHEKVAIPLVNLATRSNSNIDVDLVRNITTAIRIELEADSQDATDSLEGVEFIINNIYLNRTEGSSTNS